MKKNILLLFAMLVSLTASAQKHPFVANTQQYGQLASVLGDEAYLIDSLVVVGPINEADFTTMRDCMYEGALEVVNLEKAELENKAIPECAFYDERGYPDVKLRNIIFPDNLERIGSLALYFAKLKTLKLPSSLREIDPWALCHLDSLRMDELVIPDNVEFLGGVSLAYIQGVKKLILPKKLKKIQPFTFQYSSFVFITIEQPKLIRNIRV